MTRLDRRALFTSGAAAALLTATGVSLAAAPNRGGRMRLAVPREGGACQEVMRGAVFDTLTEIAPDGLLTASLADRWQGSEDARCWEFEIRDDVVFHSNAVMTAQHVVDSLLAHGGPPDSPFARIEAIAPHGVRIELQQGNPQLPYLLADPSLMIHPEQNVEHALANGIGTGLYRVDGSQPDRQFLGRRVRTHFRDGRAGWLDSIQLVVIPDASVRAEALRDRFVDVACLPTPDELRGRKDFRFHPSADNMVLAVNGSVGMPRVISPRGPLDDGRIAERWWMV